MIVLYSDIEWVWAPHRGWGGLKNVAELLH